MDLNTTILLVSVLAPVALKVAELLLELGKSKLPENVRYEVEKNVGDVVRSVEQSMPGATPEEKKAKAVELVNALLKASRLPVNPVVIDTLIEEAVFHLPATNSAGMGVPFGA